MPPLLVAGRYRAARHRSPMGAGLRWALLSAAVRREEKEKKDLKQWELTGVKTTQRYDEGLRAPTDGGSGSAVVSPMSETVERKTVDDKRKWRWGNSILMG
ncbi:hypothetical protein E3N88_20360 [Mikania micrantha]|uniref:Uncharacterized protein n=1 Tax=Mikania micrantha TaxID=192012 RepID=A0A5N6NJ84_9ASTR|nr:hypothetical protein E3N88_20360 [Mikania micrantha]